MKVKKVEISGFRAFKNVEDSTFDFMLPNNNIANFISIYAPNGFGKTSFYDAVEWGVTHQIQRFDRMIDFTKIRKENDGAILLNNESKKGEVNIETSVQEFKGTINPKKKYNPKGIPENKYFKEVILSQDLIDTFIKEEKADDRYNKFVEFNPDIKSYNNSLKNISKLLDNIELSIKNIKSDIDEKQKNQLKIDYDEESKKFDEINKAIEFLKLYEDELDIIEKDTFTQSKFEVLDQKVKSRIVSLNIEIETIKLRIGTIDLAYNGSPSDNNETANNGIVSYYNNRKRVQEVEKSKVEINELIKLLSEKESLETKSINLYKQVQEELNIDKLHSEIKLKFKTYSTIDAEINARGKILNKYEKEKIFNQKAIEELLEINSKKTSEIIALRDELSNKQIKLKYIPLQIEKLNLSKKKAEKYGKEISNLTDQIAEKERTIEAINLKLNQYLYFEEKVENDIDILLDFKELKNQQKLIENIIKTKNEILNKNGVLIEINDKINQQNELSKEVKDFISKGLEIISKSYTSECPLCNQEYDSFIQLSDKITDNKLFGIVLKRSIEDKLNVENQLIILDDELLKNKLKLKRELNKIINPFQVDKLKNQKEAENLSYQKNSKTQELITIENEIKEINIFFEGNIEINEFEEKIKNEIVRLENKMSEAKNSVVNNENAIKNSNTKINSSLSNTDNLLKSISELKANKEYREVINFYSSIFKTNQIDINLLNAAASDSSKKIVKINAEIEENTRLQNIVYSKLLKNDLSKQECLTKLEEIDKIILLVKKVIQNFEQYIKTEFGIDLKIINKTQADSEFEKVIATEKENLNLAFKKFENFSIVEKLKDDCLKVNETAKLQKEIDILKDEAKHLKDVADKLNKEKNNLIVFLKETIDGFFYKKLINSIYKKIDPHPDYNEIEFECDFDEKNPRLQIYTIKEVNGKKEKSVPSLYFSTAQINILSLSIFLARALKTKNPDNGEIIDCIFIDDPIQSMDSINVLSFIDLFRSLILFLNKQLIVSTHEENFHLLLQKKIPVNLFDSKYIEFETFGKLKSSALKKG
ncbi:hypothetical protein L1S35_06535 [Flavobacterium sp. AS60]|uniref:AAA family ATPase n=1 Tax=Flavobacterium anseongense TaxID=2910677 RepID=UPI001F3E8A6B|nr:AAA family ATPase [Flavobacterium sp. AS60]MCF6129323.1 hypothetical protein [Flavobacterium sp. AS60]